MHELLTNTQHAQDNIAFRYRDMLPLHYRIAINLRLAQRKPITLTSEQDQSNEENIGEMINQLAPKWPCIQTILPFVDVIPWIIVF